MKRFLPLLILLLFFANSEAGEVTFAAYNVENYLQFQHESGGRILSKPERAREALTRIIYGIHPDILGVCEMGTKKDFAEFQRRLKKAGVHFPYSEYVSAADPERHLALLSRFPIVARHSETNVPYEIGGWREKIRRGILDVTIEVAPGERIRFIGAHLKSKLPNREGQALIRRHEAELLRKHIAQILSADPKTKLVVYGDFNDTKNSTPLHEILGKHNGAESLTDIWLKDRVGDHWTEYWKGADIYSRIDFICVSRALKYSIERDKSYVDRSPDWNLASDHRALVTVIRTESESKKAQ